MVCDIHQDLFARPPESDRLVAGADEPREGDLDGRGYLPERGLERWIGYVLEQCLDQVRFMSGLLDLAGMKERIAACLSFEQNVGKQGVRMEALRALHYLFAIQGELERADFKAMLGLGERLATAQVGCPAQTRARGDRLTLWQAALRGAPACAAVLLSQAVAGGRRRSLIRRSPPV